MNTDRDTVIHAYGIVRGNGTFGLPETGVGAAGLALLDAGPVAGVFSILPEDAYGEAAWEQHAEDPDWLARVAGEHQQVLDTLVQDTDVLPLRLPAMYRDEVDLHDALTAQASLFGAVLDTLHDHLEWAVRLYYAGEPDRPATEGAHSDHDYRRRRSRALAEREEGRGRLERRVQGAYAALADAARSSVADRPQDGARTGRSEPTLLSSAHLVCRRHERFFIAAVEDVAQRLAPVGITVEVSGPWPPYNFVDLGTQSLGAPA
ncbi:GvpL/GvpF family gas vesicle protein [Nocardioides sp.]|uniref:GvpL/GvpF family gas vesicle protein n=1 Tax=Nocardioides sp. TaxID=35761 RepID=UPI002638E912|nr:GvpL/GvpF family gas vesicle protein [Nocardioides sp.]MDI6909513.1 GvpL/GvpF family gas vesicle protein [Nocardioides sp.]